MPRQSSNRFQILEDLRSQDTSHGGSEDDINTQLKRGVFAELGISNASNAGPRGKPGVLNLENIRYEAPASLPKQHVDHVSRSTDLRIDFDALPSEPYEQLARHANGAYDWVMTVLSNANSRGEREEETVYGCNLLSRATGTGADGVPEFHFVTTPMHDDIGSDKAAEAQQNPGAGSGAIQKAGFVPQPFVASTASLRRFETTNSSEDSVVRSPKLASPPRQPTGDTNPLPASVKINNPAMARRMVKLETPNSDEKAGPKRSKENERLEQAPKSTSKNISPATKKSPAKSKEHAAPQFELPGDAVARRLRQQREERKARQAAADAEKAKVAARPRWR